VVLIYSFDTDVYRQCVVFDIKKPLILRVWHVCLYQMQLYFLEMSHMLQKLDFVMYGFFIFKH
jgi:hypothetical protein